MSDIAALDKTVSPSEKFREFLSTKRKKFTREREIILEEVFSDHEHFDTDQLVLRLSGRNDGKAPVHIDLGSVHPIESATQLFLAHTVGVLDNPDVARV